MNRVSILHDLKTDFTMSQASYHELINSLSDQDLKRKSHNPGWTNGEIVFHMLLGFIVINMLLPLVKFFGRLPVEYSKAFASVLNFSTPLFNIANGFGARVGGRILSKKFVEKKFDAVVISLIQKLDTVKNSEWEQGMYYPDRWDGLFDKYMTTEKLFRYPIKHFKFHLQQIKH